MNKNAVTFTGGGLKCDNPNCDFKDMSISTKDYKKYINCPCPKCGESLLTKEDYKSFRRIAMLVKVVNFISFFIPKKEDDKKAKLSIDFDGTGTPIIGDVEILDENSGGK